MIVEGRISGDFLYRTALAQNVVPFALHQPPLVLLPVKLRQTKNPIMLSSQDILEEGALDTANWFKKVEKKWTENKTENNKDKSNTDWLDWNGKLTAQTINNGPLVIYTASAKNANATVIDRASLDLPFAVECTTYYHVPSSIEEAHYLASFLNSNYANEIIEDFQSRGLFGARHVHTKILDVALPKFDPQNKTHTAIADLGQTCHDNAATYLANEKPEANLSAHSLGRHRLAIRKLLVAELGKIDTLLKSL